MSANEPALTVTQAAARTGLPPTTIRWHCRQGLLKGKCKGMEGDASVGMYLIPESLVDALAKVLKARGRLAADILGGDQ